MSITERPTGSRTVHGVCHHDCPDTCGWVVETDDKGVAVRMRGDEDHPFSAGELCPKVNRFLDRVYRDRILTPLRRVRRRERRVRACDMGSRAPRRR